MANSIIECPFCFKTFSDKDVFFRSNTVFNDEEQLVKKASDGKYSSEDELFFSDDANISGYKKNYEKLKPFIKTGKSDKYRAFWSRYDNSEAPEPRSKARAVDIDYDFNRPVLDPNNSKVVQEKHYENDGFLTSVTDICGNKTMHRVCPHCHNPLPTNYGRYKVYHISVVGAKGSGKTVFLSQFMKEIKSQCLGIGIPIDELDKAVTRYIEENPVKENQKLSKSTEPKELVPPLSFNINIKNKGKYTFVFHDVAGENCESPEEMVNFIEFIEHSDAMIFIIDPKQINSFGIPLSSDEHNVELDKVFNNLGNVVGDKVGAIPAATVISQLDRPECKNLLLDKCPLLYQNKLEPVYSDLYKAEEDPSFNGKKYNEIFTFFYDFFKDEKTGGPWLNVRDKFPNSSFFGISAIGTDVKDNKPVSEPVPYRIAEPFFWILYKLELIKTNVTVLKITTRKKFQAMLKEKCDKKNITFHENNNLLKTLKKTSLNLFVNKKDKETYDSIEAKLKKEYIISD